MQLVSTHFFFSPKGWLSVLLKKKSTIFFKTLRFHLELIKLRKKFKSNYSDLIPKSSSFLHIYSKAEGFFSSPFVANE